MTDPASALDLDLIRAFERLASQNPLIAHVAATGDDSPLRFSDFLTLRELRELEIYPTATSRWASTTRWRSR